jgi:hypothetical protein
LNKYKNKTSTGENPKNERQARKSDVKKGKEKLTFATANVNQEKHILEDQNPKRQSKIKNLRK